MNDRELWRAFKKQRTADTFRPILDVYLPFVYAAARRQTAADAQANEVCKAAFLALARRASSISRNVVLAGWLFRAVRVAARKLKRSSKAAVTPVPSSPPPALPGAEAGGWPRLAPLLDAALEKVPTKLRDAFLVHALCNRTWEETALTLRARETSVRKRFSTSTRKLERHLKRRGLVLDEGEAVALCANRPCADPVPENLASEILAAIPLRSTRGPALALTRSTLAALTWAKWRRWLRIALTGTGAFLVLIGLLVGLLFLAWTRGPLLAWVIEWSSRAAAKNKPELIAPAQPWPPAPGPAPLEAADIKTAAEFFRITNIWPAHLKFSAAQWRAVAPKRIPTVSGAMMPADGKFILRNPKAKRSGLSGVMGYDFEWAHADFELGGLTFPDVGARFKGNGTFVFSQWRPKRPFKVNLDRFNKDQQLGGIEVVNFTNLIEDRSYMSDALGHEFFRDCGVPSPRTAYAYLDLTVEGQFERQPLGLYVLVENLDSAFAKDRFGTKTAPIFKPVTYQLFEDIGDNWSDYAPIYDLKTKATEAQQRRVVEFAKLVSHADDAEFAGRLGEFLDYDAFARFLAALTLVASYDGFFSNGQNFYVYLDPRSNKFGFIPWDMDHGWGGFPFVGTFETRERASIWQPWAGDHKFLERIMAVEEFRKIYRERMEDLLSTKFTPERLSRRIDEIANVIRPAVAAESAFRLERFEEAVSDRVLPRWVGDPFDPTRTAHQLKRFIAARARSVRDQLDGKSKGMVLDRAAPN